MPRPSAPVSARRYHHGNLKQALLDAADAILREDGIQGLKLRAIAKRAGVSHTAADPHFGDLRGLLSELAATGFERLSEAMARPLPPGVRPHADPHAQRIAHGYIGFALANPQLFVLMFRRDVLDRSRPRLRAATAAAFGALSFVAGSSDPGPLPLPAAGGLIAAWGLVHGIATLAITDYLTPLLDRVAPAPSPDRWIEAALSSVARAGRQAGRHDAGDAAG